MLQKIKKLIAGLALAVPLLATAGPFTNMYVFGDSLSDTGNLVGLNGPGVHFGPFQGAYDGGRFSNGPLWVEALANGLGLPTAAAPFIVGGNNFAFAGARTNQFTPEGIPSLIAQAFGIFGAFPVPFPGGPVTPGAIPAVDPNALYVVVGGGNDMRALRSGDPGASVLDAITGLTNTIGFLSSKGAHNILLANLPDLGLTPEAILLGLAAQSTAASNAFNAALAATVPFWEGFLGVDVNLLDLAGITSNIVANPGAFGITNTTLPCNGFVGAAGYGYIAAAAANPLAAPDPNGLIGTSCANSAFSDLLHPSALVHAEIGRQALLIYGIPEPTSLALFAVAIIGLGISRRRALAA